MTKLVSWYVVNFWMENYLASTGSLSFSLVPSKELNTLVYPSLVKYSAITEERLPE